MSEADLEPVRERRKASIWTAIHPLFALGQLLVFFVSVGLFVAYVRHAVPFEAVHVSVLVKIAMMVGAVVTGALWEHDVFGHWWFAPEFLFEDVMTLVVFVLQLSYLAMVWLHPGDMGPIVAMLIAAYTVYLANVAQYIHKTQRRKMAEPAARDLRQAA